MLRSMERSAKHWEGTTIISPLAASATATVKAKSIGAPARSDHGKRATCLLDSTHKRVFRAWLRLGMETISRR